MAAEIRAAKDFIDSESNNYDINKDDDEDKNYICDRSHSCFQNCESVCEAFKTEKNQRKTSKKLIYFENDICDLAAKIRMQSKKLIF